MPVEMRDRARVTGAALSAGRRAIVLESEFDDVSFMQTGLRDMTVLITGASGGIGQALARFFAEEGANLALQARTQLQAIRALVVDSEWQERAICLEADLASRDAAEQMVDCAVERFGRLDVCVVNAGIWPVEPRLLHELPESRVRTVLETNLLGAFWTVAAFMRALGRLGARKDGHGSSICLVGSTAGRFGEYGHGAYAVSKAGLYGLLRTVKNEIVDLDPGGRINMVEPGWTMTPMAREAMADEEVLTRAMQMVPLRQVAWPEDVAATVGYLCSPRLARHVSGEVVTVAGGMEGRLRWSPGAIDLRRLGVDRDG